MTALKEETEGPCVDNIVYIGPTFKARRSFRDRLKALDPYLIPVWRNRYGSLEIWRRDGICTPMLEHHILRETPGLPALRNWDLEGICIEELINARRFQFMSAAEFQDDIEKKQQTTRDSIQRSAEDEYRDFIEDDYWHEKMIAEQFDGDPYRKTTTKWQGAVL